VLSNNNAETGEALKSKTTRRKEEKDSIKILDFCKILALRHKNRRRVILPKVTLPKVDFPPKNSPMTPILEITKSIWFMGPICLLDNFLKDIMKCLMSLLDWKFAGNKASFP